MKERFISLQEVTERLGVVRGTLHYYLEQLKITPQKFPLDRRRYITFAEYERIRKLREEANERKQQTSPRLPSMKPEEALV